jgi:sugar O-acyltransferase (sialic acid O-acetyltransferase NeuD family)
LNVEKIVVIGAGGLSRIAIDILRLTGEYLIEGLIDDSGNKTEVDDVRVIGTDDDIPCILESGIRKAVIAIGCISVETNAKRRTKYERLKAMGFEFVNVIQPGSYVSRTAKVGSGVFMIGDCYVGPGAVIGDGVIMHPFSSVEHDTVIGNYVHLAQGAKVAGGVTVGDGVFLGMGASVVNGISVPPGTFVKGQTVYH